MFRLQAGMTWQSVSLKHIQGHGNKLEHVPRVDMEKVSRSEMHEAPSIKALEGYFNDWINRESMYVDCMNEAIHYARKIDMEIYDKLACIANRYQDEIFRARLLRDRLALGGWSGSDIAIVSQAIHHFYEHGEIDPRSPMDYNLG